MLGLHPLDFFLESKLRVNEISKLNAAYAAG